MSMSDVVKQVPEARLPENRHPIGSDGPQAAERYLVRLVETGPKLGKSAKEPGEECLRPARLGSGVVPRDFRQASEPDPVVT